VKLLPLPVVVKVMGINIVVLAAVILSTGAIVAVVKIFQPPLIIRIIAIVIDALILSEGLAWFIFRFFQLMRPIPNSDDVV